MEEEKGQGNQEKEGQGRGKKEVRRIKGGKEKQRGGEKAVTSLWLCGAHIHIAESPGENPGKSDMSHS